MDLDFQLDAVKILKCKVCQVETPVNTNYPITEVTCQRCWSKQKDGVSKTITDSIET